MVDKLKNIVLLFLLILLSGCIATETKLAPLRFKDRDTVIDSEVGLYLSNTTKTYTAQATHNASTFKVFMGDSIESDSLSSLSKVISKVSPVKTENDPSFVDKEIIELSFSPDTDLNLGTFTFSPNKVTTNIQATIYRNGKVIWKNNFKGYSQESKGGITFDASSPIGLGGDMDAYMENLRVAASTALQIALEKLNDELLSRKAIFTKLDNSKNPAIDINKNSSDLSLKATPSTKTNEKDEKLREIKRLYESGLISNDVYLEQQRKILEEPK